MDKVLNYNTLRYSIIIIMKGLERMFISQAEQGIFSQVKNSQKLRCIVKQDTFVVCLGPIERIWQSIKLKRLLCLDKNVLKF